MVIKQLVSQKV